MEVLSTSIEQSRRLLAAGLEGDTADLFWLKHEDFNGETRLMIAPMRSWQHFTDKKDECTPAWSMSSLWNLCGLVYITFNPIDYGAKEVIDCLVDTLEKKLKEIN